MLTLSAGRAGDAPARVLISVSSAAVGKVRKTQLGSQSSRPVLTPPVDSQGKVVPLAFVEPAELHRGGREADRDEEHRQHYRERKCKFSHDELLVQCPASDARCGADGFD
jgi:hypothetical protein